MEILYVSSHFNPFLSDMGSNQRYNLLLRACAHVAHVDVVVFADGVISDIPNVDVIYGHNSPLKDYGGRWNRFKRLFRPWNPYSFFQRDKNRAMVIEGILQQKKYDFIVTRYIPRALECGLLRYSDRLILDVDDYPVDTIRTIAKNATTTRARHYYLLEAWLMQWSMTRLLKKVRFSFFPNADQLTQNNSAYLPNIPYMEVEALPLPSAQCHRVLFVGDLRYEPNIIGIEHFITAVWPHIIEKVPDAELHVVGKYGNSKWADRMTQQKGVKLLGFVEDLIAEYKSTSVCVVPVYSGAGTNIKVLEALRMHRACVTSQEATRGFAGILQDGEDLLVAHSDTQFAQQVIHLLLDPSKRNAIADSGRATILNNYSHEKFNAIVKQTIIKEYDQLS